MQDISYRVTLIFHLVRQWSTIQKCAIHSETFLVQTVERYFYINTYNHAVKYILSNVRNLLELVLHFYVIAVYQLHLLNEGALSSLSRSCVNEISKAISTN